jgi:hypothetical protein
MLAQRRPRRSRSRDEIDGQAEPLLEHAVRERRRKGQ